VQWQSSGFLSRGLFVRGFSRISRFSRSDLRAVVDRAPQAEALAASWIERVRPAAVQVYNLRRRIATIAVAVAATLLFVHVMFGANGMVVYKKKRAELLVLRQQIVQVQQENDRYAQQVQGLKTDETSIEKEAREEMGYAKPGEYVYVPATPAKPTAPANRTAKK
jgi:cell division protein FtsB